MVPIPHVCCSGDRTGRFFEAFALCHPPRSHRSHTGFPAVLTNAEWHTLIQNTFLHKSLFCLPNFDLMQAMLCLMLQFIQLVSSLAF